MSENNKVSSVLDLKSMKPITIPIIALGNRTWGLSEEVTIRLSSSKVSTPYFPETNQVKLASLEVNHVALGIDEKRKVIKSHLAILIHAMVCRATDELSGNLGTRARRVRYVVIFAFPIYILR